MIIIIIKYLKVYDSVSINGTLIKEGRLVIRFQIKLT